MPNWIGDFVMATPLLKDLRKAFPQAFITALCQGACSQLLEKDPHVDLCLTFNKAFSRKEKKNLLKKIKEQAYDWGILTTNSFSSAYFMWRTHATRRVGFRKDLRHLFLSDSLYFPNNKKTQHLVTTYKELLTPLGCKISSTTPYLIVPSEEKLAVKEQFLSKDLDPQLPLIGINPGAAYGSAKCWPPERFRALIEKLNQDLSASILLFGDHSSSKMIHSICDGMPKNVLNLAGKTNLRQLVALIASCRLVLSNDSGPMHLAYASQTPVLVIFGSTDPVVTGPYKMGEVIYKQVDCSPCFKRTCPIDFRCMLRIEVEEVFEKMKKMLGDKV